MNRSFIRTVVAILMYSADSHALDHAATFESQLPAEPGVYDAPLTSTRACEIPVSPLVVKWREPTSGVTSETGLLVWLPGNADTYDCDRIFDVQDPAWPDGKNVVVCNVFYRNNTFKFPYDFGKLQISDVLRGTARVLQEYPQLDRRRLYLYGASGGGHVALQVLQSSRELWAEVHIHCAPTLITTDEDVQHRGYENDALGAGFHPMLGFPIYQGSLSDDQFSRYQAERALRSPQRNIAADLPSSGTSEIPPVWMMHGTADEGVDFQHFDDFKMLVQQETGGATQATSVLGGAKWEIGRWTFIRIDGATHSYGGAHPSLNTYTKATNYHVPSAFTRSRPLPPALSLNYAFPSYDGWTFRVLSTLTNASVSMERSTTQAGEWQIYE